MMRTKVFSYKFEEETKSIHTYTNAIHTYMYTRINTSYRKSFPNRMFNCYFSTINAFISLSFIFLVWFSLIGNHYNFWCLRDMTWASMYVYIYKIIAGWLHISLILWNFFLYLLLHLLVFVIFFFIFLIFFRRMNLSFFHAFSVHAHV